MSTTVHSENEIKTDIETEIDWRKILQNNFSKSENILQSERMWSTFCTQMRDLCPETQWLSIAQINNPIDRNLLHECKSWLTSLVASSQWPFPEKVILTFNNSAHFKLKISLVTESKLSFDFFSKSLILTPEMSAYACTWVIEKGTSKNKPLEGEI